MKQKKSPIEHLFDCLLPTQYIKNKWVDQYGDYSYQIRIEQHPSFVINILVFQNVFYIPCCDIYNYFGMPIPPSWGNKTCIKKNICCILV